MPIFHMARSVWYDLEYIFSQTGSGGAIPGLDDRVIAAGGVCSVAAIDWMKSKAAGGSFVFSEASLHEKARQLGGGLIMFDAIYQRALPNMVAGASVPIETTAVGGAAIATALAGAPCALILLGASLSSLVAGHAHLLAAVRRDGKYYLFDGNFGSFKCSYAKGVSTWFANAVNQDRGAGRGTYRSWTTQAFVLPFT